MKLAIPTLIIISLIFSACKSGTDGFELRVFQTADEVREFEESIGAIELPPESYRMSSLYTDSADMLQFAQEDKSGLVRYTYYEVAPAGNSIQVSWSDNLRGQMLVKPRNGLSTDANIRNSVDQELYPKKVLELYEVLNKQFEGSASVVTDNSLGQPLGERYFHSIWIDTNKNGFASYNVTLSFFESDTTGVVVVRAILMGD